MAAARILIAGGSGVFGRLLARELLDRTGVEVRIAGRDLRRATRAAVELGAPDRVRAIALDLNEAGSLAEAARGCVAVASTAGPFGSLRRAAIREAIDAGAHWLDISDAPAWVDGILAGDEFKDAATAVMPGLSTTPSLTGALTDWCRARLTDATFVQAAMFIGNRNEKGGAAISSAIGGGFADPARVRFPMATRTAYRFEVPRCAFGRSEIDGEFRVALEIAPAARFVSALSRAGGSARFGPALAQLARPFSRFGSDAGCVQAEVSNRAGDTLGAACVSKGQRLAILPISIALEEILSGRAMRGTVHPAGWMEPEQLLARMTERDVRFCRRAAPERLVR